MCIIHQTAVDPAATLPANGNRGPELVAPEEEPEELCSHFGEAARPLDSGILAVFCLCAPLGPGEYTKVSDFIARL